MVPVYQKSTIHYVQEITKIGLIRTQQEPNNLQLKHVPIGPNQPHKPLSTQTQNKLLHLHIIGNGMTIHLNKKTTSTRRNLSC
jgi:hypothetical protein